MPTPPMAAPHLAADTAWRDEALCRRDDAPHFYAPPEVEGREDKRARERRARALCASCPVRAACLEYSLVVQEPHGIWGGLNELQRRRLMRERAARAEPRSA